jgi:hypothetical protein
MAQTENHPWGKEGTLLPNLTLSGLAALGKKNVEEFAKAQSELLNTMQDAHRRWLDRMQSEATLASDFTRKVTTCRSIPDAVAACQEWTGRRLEMMADDSKHLLSDSRKVMERGARLLSDGLFANGRDVAGTEAEVAPGGTNIERSRAAAEPASRTDTRTDFAWK